MSRKLLAFLLSELKIIRLICKRQSCGGVIEVPVDKISPEKFDAPKCPLCGHTLLTVHPDQNPILKVASAVTAMQRLKNDFEIEFVLNDES